MFLDIFYDIKEHIKGLLHINPLRYQKGKNFCLGCGACCSYFRIYFPSSERAEQGGFVTIDSSALYSKKTAYMKGTKTFKGKCIGLTGEIGKSVSCTIYENRPNVCRDFPVILADGRQNPRCMRARKYFGLDPKLTP